MSDAAEVMAAIWEAACSIEGGQALVDACFGIGLREQLRCGRCGAVTHVHDYVQRLHNASASGLRLAALAADPGQPRPTMVRDIACLGAACWGWPAAGGCEACPAPRCLHGICLLYIILNK